MFKEETQIPTILQCNTTTLRHERDNPKSLCEPPDWVTERICNSMNRAPSEQADSYLASQNPLHFMELKISINVH